MPVVCLSLQEAITSWRIDEVILHKTLATDEVHKMSDHRRIVIIEESVSYTIVPFSATASFGCEIGSVSACGDHETPQLLDQRTQTLMRISEVTGCMNA